MQNHDRSGREIFGDQSAQVRVRRMPRIVRIRATQRRRAAHLPRATQLARSCHAARAHASTRRILKFELQGIESPRGRLKASGDSTAHRKYFYATHVSVTSGIQFDLFLVSLVRLPQGQTPLTPHSSDVGEKCVA
jgi:hypothetical protein